MKSIIFLTFLALFLYKPTFAQNKAKMEQQFLELETKWMDGWKNKDEATLQKIISDDFTLTSALSTGELVNKASWIEKALGNFDCKDFHFDKIQVRIYDNISVVNSWFHQDATANGKDWSGDFLLTDVWVNKNGEWQVVARHASWLQKK